MLLEVDIICSFYCCNASTSFTLNQFSPGGHVRWFHFRVGSYCHQLPVPSQVEPPQAITIGQTSSSNQNEGSWPTNDLGCVYSSNAEVLTRQAFSVKGHIVNSFDFASHVIFMAHTDSATYKQYVKRYMFTPIHLQLEKTGGGKIRWVKLWSGQTSFLVNAFEVIESLGSCSLLWDPSPLFPLFSSSWYRRFDLPHTLPWCTPHHHPKVMELSDCALEPLKPWTTTAKPYNFTRTLSWVFGWGTKRWLHTPWASIIFVLIL